MEGFKDYLKESLGIYQVDVGVETMPKTKKKRIQTDRAEMGLEIHKAV